MSRSGSPGAGRSKRDVAAAFFLLAVTFLFFRTVLVGEDALVTANMSRWLPWRTAATAGDLERRTFRDDSAMTYYPRRIFSDGELAAGRIPHWNRFILCGTPHLADFQSAVFHPLNLLLHFVPPKRATALFVVIHLFLGSLFLYLFLRHLRAGRVAALIGAVSFLFNAYFATYIGHPVHISTGCYAPLILLLVSKRMAGERTILLPVAVALMILGGFPQTAIYIFLIAGAWALFLWWRAKRGAKGKASARLTATALLIAAGIGLTLFQLLPTAEFGSLSDRKAADLSEILERHQPDILSAIRIALPDFYGNPVSENFWLRAIDGPRPHPSDLGFIGYGGIVPLILAIAALLFRRRREVFFFGALAAATLLLTFSPQAYSLYYTLFPFVRFSTELHRLQFPFLLALAVLAGLGFQEIIDRSLSPSRRRAPAILLFVILGALPLTAALVRWEGPRFLDFAAARMTRENGATIEANRSVSPAAAAFLAGDHDGWLRSEKPGLERFLLFGGAGVIALLVLLHGVTGTARTRIAAGAILLVATTDGWTFARLYHTPQRSETIFAPHPLLDQLASGGDPFRVARLTRQYFLPPNTGLPYGIEDVAGVNALMPGAYGRIFEAIDPSLFPDGRRITPFSDPSVLSLPLWNLLGVRYLLVGPQFDPDAAAAAGNGSSPLPRWTVTRRGGKPPFSSYAILENRAVLPRAFLSHTYEVIPDEREILDRIVSPRFSPAGPILLEKAPPFPSGREATLEGDRCELVPAGSQEVVVRTSSTAPALLFLSENDYPGWEALIDGRRTPITRADYAFRAVPLEAGEHEVRFRYRAAPFRRGAVLSALVLAIYLAWMIGIVRVGGAIRRSRRRPTSKESLSALHG